ncbi:MAG: TIGR03560 family F420-dependent LLM class oxidoreductase [Chloroflexota bacterium]|nr:TIGR03560 family F420-dependent LLM class oxidoreductase [Chloroflexota bacterium]
MHPNDSATTTFGAQLWSQATDWPRFQAAALEAEAAGWDSLWTWDHLMAIQGPWRQPIFEGWASLAAWAALTSRIRLGLMVGANTFRNPGLTAKLATTLDHISAGRAILGIGGAWFEREHDAHGIDFGPGVGERLDRLDEAVGIIRRLLDGETVDHAGQAYRFHDAEQLPRPIQDHLPILVGGSGPKKTLRTVARHADAWNTSGTLEEVAARDAILREHCLAVGRDQAEIERTVSFPIVIRDRPDDAEATFTGLLEHHGIEGGIAGMNVPVLLGPPAEVATAILPYRRLGFATVIVRLPAPFDAETLARIGEVRTVLDQLEGAGPGG